MIEILFYIWLSYRVPACQIPDNLKVEAVTYREARTNRIITDYTANYKGVKYRIYLIDDKITDCKINKDNKWRPGPKCPRITYSLLKKGQRFGRPYKPAYCSIPVRNINHK